MEAITSAALAWQGVRPSIAVKASRSSQHAEADKARVVLSAIHALIDKFKSAAEQFKVKSVWQLVCEHIVATVARFRPKILLPIAPPISDLSTVN
jgi:hypothetical protein